MKEYETDKYIWEYNKKIEINDIVLRTIESIDFIDKKFYATICTKLHYLLDNYKKYVKFYYLNDDCIYNQNIHKNKFLEYISKVIKLEYEVIAKNISNHNEALEVLFKGAEIYI